MFLSNRVLWWPLKYLSRAYIFVSLCNFKYLSRMPIVIHDVVILIYFHFHVRSRDRLPSIKWTLFSWRLVSISHNDKGLSSICGTFRVRWKNCAWISTDEHQLEWTKYGVRNNYSHTKAAVSTLTQTGCQVFAILQVRCCNLDGFISCENQLVLSPFSKLIH